MEENRKNIRNKNEKNKILENIRKKNENCHLNDAHFLFDKEKRKSNKNLKSNIIIENINSNENIDNEEDKKEEEFVLKEILWNLNMSENETKDDKTCQEILDILKKPRIGNKKGIFISPFKPLLKPKKISMEGRVLNNDQNNCINAN